MKKIITLALLSTVFTSVGASAVEINSGDINDGGWLDKDRFQVRLRAIQVDPDEDSRTSIGGQVHAKSTVAPEIDFTYFITENVAAELIAATTYHDLYANGTGLGNLYLGEAGVLPPTLTFQYHFLPDSNFRPYVGAGVNYTYFYDENNSTAINRLELESGFGVAVQAGADFMIDEHWGINLDVKRIYLPVDAKINSGAITADVNLDPWVIGTGITYRF